MPTIMTSETSSSRRQHRPRGDLCFYPGTYPTWLDAPREGDAHARQHQQQFQGPTAHTKFRRGVCSPRFSAAGNQPRERVIHVRIRSHRDMGQLCDVYDPVTSTQPPPAWRWNGQTPPAMGLVRLSKGALSITEDTPGSLSVSIADFLRHPQVDLHRCYQLPKSRVAVEHPGDEPRTLSLRGQVVDKRKIDLGLGYVVHEVGKQELRRQSH